MLGAALSMPSTRTAGNVEGLTTHHSVSSPQYCASYRGVRASPPPHPRLCMPQRPQGPKRQPPGPFGPCRGLAFHVMSRVDGIARATERESGGEVLSRDSHMVLPRPSRLTGASCPWATTPPPWGFEISRARELEFLVGRSGDGHTWLAAMNFGGLAVFRVEDWVSTTLRGAFVDR